jgi:hypothetical protein
MVVASSPQISLPLYLERKRKAPRALCVLCVKTHLQPRPCRRVGVHPERLGSFSSPDLCPFNFRLLALFTLRSEGRNEGSVVEGSTVDRTSLCPFHNSHRITSFAYPHPLTPIESYSCKKQGEGVPLTPSRRRGTSYLCVTHRNPRNPNFFMRLLHNSRTARGWGATTHHSLLTVHP